MLRAPRFIDAVLLISIALMWGSSFLFVEFALKSFSPLAIVAARTAIAAAFLSAIAVAKGYSLKQGPRDWFSAGLVAVSGAVIPFFLIPWGQQRIDSSAAAVIMGSVPLITLVLAHYMTRDERITPRKAVGLVIGLAGVVLLVGGAELRHDSAGMLGQLAILLAAFGYAISSVFVRRLAHLPSILGSTLIMVVSGAVSLVLGLTLADWPALSQISFESLLAVLFLGIFPSALAAIFMVHLVTTVGVNFLALNNYLVPVVGLVLGVAFLGEPLRSGMIGALLLILGGIAVAQLRMRWSRWR